MKLSDLDLQRWREDVRAYIRSHENLTVSGPWLEIMFYDIYTGKAYKFNEIWPDLDEKERDYFRQEKKIVEEEVKRERGVDQRTPSTSLFNASSSDDYNRCPNCNRPLDGSPYGNGLCAYCNAAEYDWWRKGGRW